MWSWTEKDWETYYRTINNGYFWIMPLQADHHLLEYFWTIIFLSFTFGYVTFATRGDLFSFFSFNVPINVKELPQHSGIKGVNQKSQEEVGLEVTCMLLTP